MYSSSLVGGGPRSGADLLLGALFNASGGGTGGDESRQRHLNRSDLIYSVGSGHPSVQRPSTQKRKTFGPIVSDRKWGTDIGEIEVIGQRIDVLFDRLIFLIYI